MKISFCIFVQRATASFLNSKLCGIFMLFIFWFHINEISLLFVSQLKKNCTLYEPHIHIIRILYYTTGASGRNFIN